ATTVNVPLGDATTLLDGVHQIMKPHVLSYHSRPTLAVVQSGEPQRITVGAFTAGEGLVEPSQSLPKSVQASKVYFVGFQCEVSTHEEVKQRSREFAVVASEISMIWHYVFGCAYGSPDRAMESEGEPMGWASNRQKVERDLPSIGPRIGAVRFQAFAHYNFPTWPLRDLLHVREIFLRLDKAHRFL